MEIDLPDDSYDIEVVSKLIKKLLGFDVNKSTYLEAGIELSIYLFAIGSKNEAIKLLESFAFNVSEDGSKGFLLANKIDALSTLSYMCYSLGDSEKKLALSSQVVELSSNVDLEEIDWLIDDFIDELDYYKEDRATLAEMKGELTEMELIQGHKSNIIKFSYFHCVLIEEGVNLDKRLASELNSLLENEFKVLNEELIAD